MKNNKELLSVLESLQDLVLIIEYKNNDFYYVFANKLALKYLGENNISDKKLVEVVGIEKEEALVKRYKEVIDTKSHLTYEDRVIGRKGATLYGETTLSPILDCNGQVEKIISITRDITDYYLEKKRIVEYKSRYKSLFKHNLDGIITLDANGTIVKVNEAILSILTYEEKDMLRKSIFDLISVKSIKAFYSIISPTLLGQPSESTQCELLHRDGSYKSVHMKTVPIVVNDTIKGIYLIVRDITTQIESEKKIQILAERDNLTGFYNRGSLLEHIGQSILKHRLRNVEFAVMIINIDRFKVVNEALGHSLGDEAIKEFSTRIRAFSAKGITFYRIGVDEFALLIEPCSQRKAVNIARKLIGAISEPIVLNKAEYYMTCTIGIGMYPTDGKDATSLIQNATIALYRGKDNDRGNYQFYSSDFHHLLSRSIGMEMKLRKSIVCNELVVYYQPQVDINTNEIYRVEALVHWNSHDYGLVQPSEFLPIAEKTSFILEIGEWVIHEVCSQLKEWIDKGYEPIPVGINLSPKQFLSPTLFETVQNALLINQIHPSLITIEIMESAMLDPVRTMEVLKKLKEIGVYISVDDFGTVFSYLNYLKNFPIDILKIERSFISEIGSSKKDAALTTTLIQLAQLLQLDVVATGVETKEQIDFLRSRKCMHVQGYFFSEAISNEEFEGKYLAIKK